jgi:hypothetical protein
MLWHGCSLGNHHRLLAMSRLVSLRVSRQNATCQRRDMDIAARRLDAQMRPVAMSLRGI